MRVSRVVLLAVSPGLVLPVIFLAIASGLPELVYVSLSTYLQHNTRSEFRATSMSIAEGCFSIQMLWLFPLVGLLSQHSGYTAGFARVRRAALGRRRPVHRLAAVCAAWSRGRSFRRPRRILMPMNAPRKQIAENRKARHDFHIVERVEAGIALTGTEVKSLRDGGGNIREAYAQLRGGEVFLVGANIAPYKQGNLQNHEPTARPQAAAAPPRDRAVRRRVAQRGNDAGAAGAVLLQRPGQARAGPGASGKEGVDKRHSIADRESKRQLEREVKERFRR